MSLVYSSFVRKNTFIIDTNEKEKVTLYNSLFEHLSFYNIFTHTHKVWRNHQSVESLKMPLWETKRRKT